MRLIIFLVLIIITPLSIKGQKSMLDSLLSFTGTFSYYEDFSERNSFNKDLVKGNENSELKKEINKLLVDSQNELKEKFYKDFHIEFSDNEVNQITIFVREMFRQVSINKTSKTNKIERQKKSPNEIRQQPIATELNERLLLFVEKCRRYASKDYSDNRFIPDMLKILNKHGLKLE